MRDVLRNLMEGFAFAAGALRRGFNRVRHRCVRQEFVMTEVTPRLKEMGECPCEDRCGLVGFFQSRKRKDGLHHVRGCVCKRCKFARVRAGGQRAQRDMAKRSGNKKVGSLWVAHEEQFGGETREEMKSGAQVRPGINAFDKHKAQNETARPVGDTRPFVAHWKLTPRAKRQITAFESNTDEEYRQTLWAMCMKAGVKVP
jgi:hypothetical protein